MPVCSYLHPHLAHYSEMLSFVAERLRRFKQKVTGAILHHLDGYFVFRTLPYVHTGANLVLTILLWFITEGYLTKAEHVWIQWDGVCHATCRSTHAPRAQTLHMDAQASDNVNYTNPYFFIWLLLAMEKCGMPTHTITLARFLVGVSS